MPALEELLDILCHVTMVSPPLGLLLLGFILLIFLVSPKAFIWLSAAVAAFAYGWAIANVKGTLAQVGLFLMYILFISSLSEALKMEDSLARQA